MKTNRLLLGMLAAVLATDGAAIALAQYPPLNRIPAGQVPANQFPAGELPRRSVPATWQGAEASTEIPARPNYRENTPAQPVRYQSAIPPVERESVQAPLYAAERPVMTTTATEAIYDAKRRTLTVRRCLVQALEDIEIPATQPGRLVEVNVKPGVEVTTDKVMAKLDDSQAKLNLKAAQQELDAALKQSTDDVDVRFAQAALEVAKAELKQANDVNLRNPGNSPLAEIRRLQLAVTKAELAVDKAKLEQQVAELNAQTKQAAVDSAKDNLARCEVKALAGGDVITLFRKQGEWINEGEPLARVIRLDELHVLGQVSGKDWDPADLDGRAVTVEVEMARGRVVPLEGQVTYVAPMLQAGSLYRIQATVKNQMDRGHWVMRPGGEAKMIIRLE
jgi:multidrug efflux pump subunit AcrA (membrane-fusion protein)